MKISTKKRSFAVTPAVMIIFLLGVCCGAAIVNLVPQENRLAVISPVMRGALETDRLRAFGTSYTNMLRPVLFIWCFGLFPVAVYGIIAATAYRGGILGFFIGSLIKCLGAKEGLVFALAAAFTHNALYIPVLVLAAVYSFENYVSRRKGILRITKSYISRLLLLAFCCLLPALCDTFVTAFFIRLVQKAF